MTGDPGAGGFSLVEMLVVVAVVSILAVGASLPLARVGASAAEDAAALTRAAARMRDLALVSGRTHALALTPGGWAGERRVGAGWEPVAPPERFGAARIAGGQRLVMLPDGRTGEIRFRLEGRGSALCVAGPEPLTCGPG